MYAVPRALHQYKGIEFNGKVIYPTYEEYIPNSAVDDDFINNFSNLIQRLASPDPARRVPSELECSFCNITSADCPQRIENGEHSDAGETQDF